jgi:hypothetical protein
MNKKLIPILVILALVAGAVYYLKMSPTSMSGDQTTSQTTSEAREFAKAMESGKPTTCTMTKGTDSMEYLIKGKKMRANITASVNGKTTISHMINDTVYFYMWSHDQKTGTKMSAVIPSPSPLASAEKESVVPEFYSEADYEEMKNEGYVINCKSGSIDDSVFVPPTDVKFTDTAELMKQITMPEGGQVDYQKLQEQYGSMQDAYVDGNVE